MVDQITLTADSGRPLGSRPARRLRAEGKIPAVVYGATTDPTPISVEWSELRAALTTDAGMNALITLDVDGAQKLTIVKDMQRHSVRRDVTHVDFIVIDRDVALDVDVPISLINTDATHLSVLVVDQNLFSLPVSAKPGSIPNEFVVDCEALDIDAPIRVGDLTMPTGVELNIDPEEAIVVASVPMSEEQLEAEIEAEAGEVAEAEGEIEEGEAPEGEEAEGGDEAEAEAAADDEG